MIGFQAPFPAPVLHGGGLGDLPHPKVDLVLVEFDRRHAGRVKVPAHVAHLMRSVLEWADSAGDEGPKEVISGHPLFLELEESGVELLDIGVFLARLVLPVVFLDGGGGRRAIGRRERGEAGRERGVATAS